MPRQREDDMTDAEFAEAIEESRRFLFVGLTRVRLRLGMDVSAILSFPYLRRFLSQSP